MVTSLSDPVDRAGAFFAEGFAVLSFLCTVTGVLQQNYVAVLHSCYSCLSIVADYGCICCELNFLTEKLS